LKAILFVADGMADRPIKELGWRTPLEAAKKPSLNKIAKTGICGLLDPISPGKPPGSDVATLALLGYDASQVYSGRGALEAVGSGSKVLPGDVAFRCNFATVNKNGIILDRRAGRIASDDAAKLGGSLQKIKLKKYPSIRFEVKSTIQHRVVLNIHGSKLSVAVSDSDPGKAGVKVSEIESLDDSPEAKMTSRIVKDLLREFHKVLEKHPVNNERIKLGLSPANSVLCRGAGRIPDIKTLSQLYNIRAACVAAVPLVRGACKVAGMRLIDVEGATGTPQTDYRAKAEATVQALKNNDLVFLHVKATDVASHDHNSKQKVEVIEKVDEMLGYLLGEVDLDLVYFVITADHTTSVVTGNHEGDPVPLAISGPYVRRDDVMKYDERSCAKGGLHRIRGSDLMPILMNLLGKNNKFGA
jgi:2,3-bisphosphoglycerate-independent phosphoglycerate mutase